MPRDVHLVGSVPWRSARRGVRDGQRGARAAAQAHPRRRDRRARATGSSGSSRCSPTARRWRSRTRCSALHADGDAAHPLPAQARPFGRGRDASTTCSTPTSPSARIATSRGSSARERSRPHCRFQIDLVPAHSVIWLFLQDDLHAPLDPIYNAALKREIDKIAARAAARSDRDPVRRRVGGVRAARAQRRDRATAAARPRRRQTFSAHPDRSRQPRAARHRAAVPFLLRRFQPPARGRADRHGRHGGDGEPADATASTRPIELIHMPVPRDRSDDAYFAPLKALEAQARDRALPRPRASHRRRRRHAQAPGGGGEGTCRISRSRPNAASAAAGRRPFRNCLRIHAEVAG